MTRWAACWRARIPTLKTKPDQEPGMVCPAPLSATYTDCTNYSLGPVSGDSNTYSVVTAIDPNRHASLSYLDPLGRVIYMQLESGKFGRDFTVNELKTIATPSSMNPPQSRSRICLHKRARPSPAATNTTQLRRPGAIDPVARSRPGKPYLHLRCRRTDDQRCVRHAHHWFRLRSLEPRGLRAEHEPSQSAHGGCTSGAL